MFRYLVLLSVLGWLTAGANFAQEVQVPAGAVDFVPRTNDSTETEQLALPREDWTKLPVDRAILKRRLGITLGKTETPDYTRELVRLEWRPTDWIDMYVILPRNVQKPRPILYLYSYQSDVDRFMDDGWCKRATRFGMAAVGFDSAFSGHRFHAGRPMKQWFVSQLQESLGATAHDVQLIIDYLAARKDLSVDQVGIWAQYSGAAVAILAAAVDPRIAAIDLVNPWADWPDWLKTSLIVPENERPDYLTPEFLKKVSMLDPIDYLPQLKNRALRVQLIMDDPETPTPIKEKIAAATPPGALVQYKDLAAYRKAWELGGLSGWIATQPVMATKSAATGDPGPAAQ